jgi:ribosomal protein S21
MEDKKEFKKPITLPENAPVDYAFENMLKKFKRESEEIIREVKERRYYRKPSALKREQLKKSKRK